MLVIQISFTLLKIIIGTTSLLAILIYFSTNTQKSSLLFLLAFCLFFIARISGSSYLNYQSKKITQLSTYFLQDEQYSFKKLIISLEIKIINIFLKSLS